MGQTDVREGKARKADRARQGRRAHLYAPQHDKKVIYSPPTQPSN